MTMDIKTTEWEEGFDEKWFRTEKVSETLNQHRWLMKD